ncbi:hypothetical protein BVX98_06275 [bacterium F11]|nr:hypothetical protein BVX98_06275 [bacterium F11]
MRDVATRCGVSISTVSLVLSGDARIPEDTTRRVLQAVKAMEYRPSVVARNLARRSSRTIGVILPEFALTRNQPFFYQAIQGIHSQTQSAGYKIIVEAANPSFLERRYYHRLLKEQSVDGIVYLAANREDSFLNEMVAEPYSFVLLGSTLPDSDLDMVRGDDMGGAKMATDHLISLGHKKIGHLAGLMTTSHSYDREKGYREAMTAAGLTVQHDWVQQTEYDLNKSVEATNRLINEGVTAIFAGGDVMAYGALRALHKNGKNVPSDMALVGMDDLEMSNWISPTLSTVRFDIAEMAALAVKYIINKVQSPLIKKSTLTDVPQPKLIVRDSCGAKR